MCFCYNKSQFLTCFFFSLSCACTVSSQFQSPLDSTTAFSQNTTTQQLLKRLYITRKLLALKKLSLKNQAMAVNLESLLPQALLEASFPLVPSSGAETESLLSDIFSSNSMYGNENLPFLEVDSDSMPFDLSLLKDPAMQPQFGDDGVQYLESGEPLYQTNASGV